jgi:predicted transcriptional regulator
MEMLPVKPERKAQLDDYAQRHGQDTVTALDEVLEKYLEWEQRDYKDSVKAIRRGYEDVETGRTRPVTEFLEEIREKHGFPR